jgi:hypothetical protein
MLKVWLNYIKIIILKSFIKFLNIYFACILLLIGIYLTKIWNLVDVAEDSRKNSKFSADDVAILGELAQYVLTQ